MVETTITLSDLAKSAFKKLRKAIRRLGSSPNNVRIHEIRIKTKLARYAAELAEQSAGKSAARFIEEAQRLQDLLGCTRTPIPGRSPYSCVLEAVDQRAGGICRRTHGRTPAPASRGGRGKNAAALAWALKARRESLGIKLMGCATNGEG